MVEVRQTVAFLAVLAAVLSMPLAASADSVNVIANGSFEEEYILGVSSGWTGFHNGGLASYGFHQDTWSPVVYDGASSQLLEIDTKSLGASETDRYMGIYQVVSVVPDSSYMFSVYGMARSTEGTELESHYNYRVQVGFDYSGGTDPWAVTDWVEMPWRESPRLAPGPFESYALGISTTSDKLTVFIRAWKKFGTPHQEGNINIDAVSLVGPDPAAVALVTPAPAAPTLPQTGGGSDLPIAGGAAAALMLGLGGARLWRSRRTR